MLLTKTSAAQSDAALNYHSVRGLYFPSVIFALTIFLPSTDAKQHQIPHSDEY